MPQLLSLDDLGVQAPCVVLHVSADADAHRSVSLCVWCMCGGTADGFKNTSFKVRWNQYPSLTPQLKGYMTMGM